MATPSPLWARAGATLAVAALALAAACTRTAPPPAKPAAFQPPPLSAIPAGPEGESIRRGLAIFDNPKTNASAYVGNAMACRNCHLDSGRTANSAPMWAAWVSYPQFRKKTRTINTIEDRIQQCFLYSQNAPNSPSGGPPPLDSPIYRDLAAYFHWLATGAPTGAKLPGSGYPTPPLPAGGYDPAKGATLFQARCSGCHGADGQGASSPDGKPLYPALWGPRSFNWGAGMARIDLAAGFIAANMPLGQGGTLTGDEAWHLAAYVDSHERPKDPRQTGSVEANAKANFAGQKCYYGQTVDGKALGAGVAGAR